MKILIKGTTGAIGSKVKEEIIQLRRIAAFTFCR